MTQLPTLTKEQLSQARVIAKGRRIRDWKRLVEQYGGLGKNWVKKSSSPFFWQDRLIEIHWYEQHGIGRFEMKMKRLY